MKRTTADQIVYYWGQDARLEDKPHTENPYPTDSWLHDAWFDGWETTNEILNGEDSTEEDLIFIIEG